MPKGVYERTEAHRAANAESHRGRVHSEEAKAKMAEARKAYWAARREQAR